MVLFFLTFCDPMRCLCLVFPGSSVQWENVVDTFPPVISHNTIVRHVSFRRAGHLSSPLLSLPLLSQVFHALCRGNPAGMLSLLLSSKIQQHLGCTSHGMQTKRKPKSERKKSCGRSKRLDRRGKNELCFHVHSLSF